MQGKQHSDFGEAEALQILNAGWRQGSVFRPPESFAVPVRYNRDREVLVVCTQSCTVVSKRLNVDPSLEFLVAEPVKKYSPKSAEATGKNLRLFHLPVTGLHNVQAYACDINRRFLVDRRICLTHSPDASVKISGESVQNLAGWIARYYTRIALSDELVRRAQKELFAIIKTALQTKNTDGEELSSSIDKIGIGWSPNSELQSGVYEVDILFLCADSESDVMLNSLLTDPLTPFSEEDGKDGIKLKYGNTVRNQTFMDAFDGYRRLTEWDYLSSLGSIAEDES